MNLQFWKKKYLKIVDTLWDNECSHSNWSSCRIIWVKYIFFKYHLKTILVNDFVYYINLILCQFLYNKDG